MRQHTVVLYFYLFNINKTIDININAEYLTKIDMRNKKTP